MRRYQSPSVHPKTATRKWVVVDVENKVLGRAASRIAVLLRGKHRPTFTAHLDSGDFVVVINAKKIRLTGKKWDDKISYNHSGYPGGLRSRSAREVMAKNPDELLRTAVWGMLPKGALSRQLMTKLKIYPEATHPHAAQAPQTVAVA